MKSLLHRKKKNAPAFTTVTLLGVHRTDPGCETPLCAHSRGHCRTLTHTTMARNGLRTRPPGVDPMVADGDGRRIPFVSIPRHTLILLARASAQYSLPRPRNGNFAHASRSDGPRNLLELQALCPAQPSALVLYCSDFTLTLFHTGRSLDHRKPTGAQRAASARSGFLIVCCSDCTPASFPYASAFFTHSHTLSLDSFCRPTAGKSSSPAGLFLPLVYAYVVDCASASPYAYSSSTHRSPDERTPIEATPLSATSAELGLELGLGLGWDSLSRFSSHALPFFSPPSFHTLSLSLVCGGQTSPRKPWLVVSHSTCPPLSSSPHANLY